MRYIFPFRPLVASVSDCAGNGEKAFININRFHIYDTVCAATFEAPALFISDGMSIPDILQSKMQGEDGIAAGHVHDLLYSKANTGFADMIAKKAEDPPRAVADKILECYLASHCPGFREIEVKQATLAVRVFGRGAFRDPEQDEWRRKVAARLGGLPGDGCGVQPGDNPWSLDRTIKELSQRRGSW